MMRLAIALLCAVPLSARAAALEAQPAHGLVGSRFDYEVRKGDSVAAISARHAVPERALIRDNGLKPPYRVRAGAVLRIDNRHVVPRDLADGVLINIPQRLLFVFRDGRVSGAYAVALGRRDWQTPTGAYRVLTLEQDKPWIVPPSIQEEMRLQGKPVLTRVEPGPDNPLGRYWIGLTLPGYGIHGTNAPASIYAMRTHGCIRVHPEDIEAVYRQVAPGTAVHIVYAHAALRLLADGRIVAEVNPDVYNRGGDAVELLRSEARRQGLEEAVDWALAARYARTHRGQALEIGRVPAPPAGARAAPDSGAHITIMGTTRGGCN